MEISKLPVPPQPISYAPEQDALARLQVTLAINYWGAFYLTHLLLSRINQQAFSRCTMAVAATVSNSNPMPSLLAVPLPSVHTWGITLKRQASLFWLQNSVCEQYQRVSW